ncbi:MAG: dihydrofolate reductase [Alphaproteobacteria bacterium]|nr:dihydrofolate reductase [Alphaproteobacteria bacterium]
MAPAHPRLSLIVAMAKNRIIGGENRLLWHIPEDLKRFKALTMGKPVIMGRRTFESIVEQLGKPLPGRPNIVVSRSGYKAEGASVFPDLEQAIAHGETLTEGEIFIIGGAQIYAQALPLATRIYLTEIDRDYEGDAFFPALSPSAWRIEAQEPHEGDPAFTFFELTRP